MPVQIGQTSPDFSQPISLMSDCHRRIEMFLAALTRVGESAAPDPLSPSERNSLDAALKYFREAGPRHTADEEQSLFPRMRRSTSGKVAAVMLQVDSLEHEHARAQRLHQQIDAIGLRWLASGTLPTPDLNAFRAAVAQLEAIYAEHIRLEDTVVFPAAAHALSPEEQREVGREMAARRGLNAAP